MKTESLSPASLAIIEGYTNVPYFNNKSKGRRAGLRVEIGKGSPQEISDEVKDMALREKNDIKNLSGVSLKKFMVEHNLGIECSGFVFHVLNEEIKSRGKGNLASLLSFPFSTGFIGGIRAKLRPIENTDVKTFAHDQNSKSIQMKDVRIGDIVTMISETKSDHILVVYQIDYENNVPKTLYYTHAMAWPTDGEFNHGLHKGKIEISDINKPLIKQTWIELEKEGQENYTFMRAQKLVTVLRRLNCLV